MRISVTDSDSREVWVEVSGRYNPDILDDMTTRVGKAYKAMLNTETDALIEDDAEVA